MKKTTLVLGKRSGSTLFVVMGLTLLGTLAASSVAYCTGSRVRQAHKQVDLEQAFYLAEAGAERAASYVAAGNDTSTTLSGSLGTGSYATVLDCQPMAGGEVQIDVTSVGTVGGVSHTVTMHGLRRVSWARYALWYNTESVTPLWLVPGEHFGGRFYAKPQLAFHDKDLATKGQVRFDDKVWSAWTGNPPGIKLQSAAVSPIFTMGLTLKAAAETMASVNFSDLLAKSTANGKVLSGQTTIVINGNKATITNTRAGYVNYVWTIPTDGLLYVKTVTTGTTSTQKGDITVSAPNGLEGRLTLVSDNDVSIVDHVRYKNNPNPNVTPNYPNSTDALGLIAKRSVVVQPAAPNNLDIYAHIICQTGGFGVLNHDTGSARGMLNVYGGIVNSIRNAVGTTGGTGYLKNYIFDTRFSKTPPPYYPVVTDELEWTAWEG